MAARLRVAGVGAGYFSRFHLEGGRSFEPWKFVLRFQRKPQ